MRSAAERLAAQAAAAEPQATSTIKQAVAGTRGTLADLDSRLKTVDRLERKIGLFSTRMSVEDAATKVNDALRYRLVAEAEDYATTVTNVSAALRQSGLIVDQVHDAWSDSRYKGVNVTYLFGSQRLEVQMHTTASYQVAASARARELYEQARAASGRARREIDLLIKGLWADVTPPAGPWTL